MRLVSVFVGFVVCWVFLNDRGFVCVWFVNVYLAASESVPIRYWGFDLSMCGNVWNVYKLVYAGEPLKHSPGV